MFRKNQKDENKRHFNPKRTIAILAVLTAIISISGVMAAVTSQQRFPVDFNPVESEDVTFEVRVGGSLYENGTRVDFGDVTIGETKTLEMSVTNNGNVPITIDVSITGSFDPDWSLTWSCEGEEIPVSGMYTGDLTISIPDWQEGDPTTFDMIVTSAASEL